MCEPVICWRSGGAALGLFIGLLLVAQIEALEFDLNRLNVSTTTTTTTTAPSTTASLESRKTITLATIQPTAATISGQLVASDAKPPPVYMSAPKQISGLQEIRAMPANGPHSHAAERESSQGLRYEKSAGSGSGWPKRRPTRAKKPKRLPAKRRHRKKHNRKRIVAVRGREKQQQQPKRRIVKSKPKKRRVAHHEHEHRYQEQHHDEPMKGRSEGSGAGGAPSAAPSKSKYYEYRSVPSKGAWKFGFRRGNDKHAVQRKEHGHKSHFKTEMEWTDKEGRGHQLFDYNHADHGKGSHKSHRQTYEAEGTKPLVAHQLRQVEAPLEGRKGQFSRRKSNSRARQVTDV